MQFTKYITPLWVFFTFFKLYKWHQIAQNITYDQCVIPTETYDAEMWHLPKKLSFKPRKMLKAHERLVLNIIWKKEKQQNGFVIKQELDSS